MLKRPLPSFASRLNGRIVALFFLSLVGIMIYTACGGPGPVTTSSPRTTSGSGGGGGGGGCWCFCSGCGFGYSGTGGGCSCLSCSGCTAQSCSSLYGSSYAGTYPNCYQPTCAQAYGSGYIGTYPNCFSCYNCHCSGCASGYNGNGSLSNGLGGNTSCCSPVPSCTGCTPKTCASEYGSGWTGTFPNCSPPCSCSSCGFGYTGTTGCTSGCTGCAARPCSALYGTDYGGTYPNCYEINYAPRNLTNPVIQGPVVIGNTISVTNGTWDASPSVSSYSYQWRLNGANIVAGPGSMNTSSYTIAGFDYGQQISACVTATNSKGSTQSCSSSFVVPALPPSNTVLPSIDGVVKAGNTLTGAAGSWSGVPAPGNYTYLWVKCDSTGGNCQSTGNTGTTYNISYDDIGSRIRFRVTANNIGGTASADSLATTAVTADNEVPSNTSLPSISGAESVGNTLTSQVGEWKGYPRPTYAYQWQRCDSAGENCADISGATQSTYNLVQADREKRIRVRITATNSLGSVSAVSPASSVINEAPTNIALPTISGEPRSGQTLSGNNGSWDGFPAPTFSYQWQRCDDSGSNCSNINGATSINYTVAPADAGQTLRIGVIAQNAAGSLTRYSQVSDPASSSPANNSLPGVHGRPEIGTLLTASVGSWSAFPADLTYTYQWQRCNSSGSSCSDISGATSNRYTVQSADNSSTLRVRVAVSNAFGQAAATSPPTPVVQSAGGGWTSISVSSNPIDVAVDDVGNVYTANYGSNNIGKITTGGSVFTIGSAGTSPRGIVVDKQGNVYTADQGSNQVTKLTWNGSTYSRSTLAGTGSSPSEIALDSQGNIYTSNQSSNNVSKITPQGSSSIIGTVGSSPYGIAVDAQDNIYTTNYSSYTVSKLTWNGQSYSVSTAGSTGANPVGIGVDKQGNIYAANYSSNTVTKLAPSGTSYTSSTLGSVGSSPWPLALDRVGNIYTGNMGASTVSRLSRAGSLSTPGSTGSNPYGIALDERRGYGYTANYSSSSVSRFTLPWPPELVLERLSSTPTKNSPIQFTFSADKSLSYGTISSSDFTITNGTWSSISPTSNASSYTISVTPSGQGPVTIAPSGSFSVSDTGGIEQTEIVGGGSRRVVYDTVAPTVRTLTKTAPAASLTGATTISYAISFSESVSGFAASDIIKAGTSTANFTASNIQGSGANYTFDLVRQGDAGVGGTVLPTISAGSVQDAAGNDGPASVYNGPVITVDYTAPEGGSLNPPAWSTSGTFNLNVTDFVDAESGIKSQVLERRTGTLSGGDCTSWSNTWQATAVAQETISTGCYEYRLVARNELDLETTFTASPPTKVDRTAPSGGAMIPPAWSTDGNFSLGVTNYTDSQSGIITQTLERRDGTLANNTCTGYSDWGATENAQENLASGCYEYRLQATNGAGGVSTLTRLVKVDLTPPEGGVLSSPPWSTDGAFSLTTTNYSDPQSGIASQALERREGVLSNNECSGYSAWQATAPQQTGLESGCYEYRLVASNNAGVERTLESLTKVDLTAPQGGSITAPEWSTESALQIEVTDYADPQSAIGSQVFERRAGALRDGGCFDYDAWQEASVEQTGLQTGCYQYRLRAENNASMQSSTQATVKVDLSPPEEGQINAPEWSGSGEFTVDAVPYGDPHSGMLFNKLERRQGSLDQGVCGSWGEWDDTIAAQSGLESGCYQYRLTGKNGAGVEVSTFATTRVDTDPPQGGAISSPEWSKTGTFSVTTEPYSDPQSGITSSKLEVRSGILSEGNCSDFGAWQETGSAQADLQNGCYEYRLSATSGVGETASVTTTTKVDTTPPEGGQITAPEWSTDGTFSVDVADPYDPDSGILNRSLERRFATISDGQCQNWQGFSGTVSSQENLATGCYQYRSTVVSGAGYEEIYLATTKVDRSNPINISITPSNPTGNTWIGNNKVFYAALPGYSGSFRVSADASDQDSGIASALFPTAQSLGVVSGGGEENTAPYNTTYQWSGASPLLSGTKQVRIYNRAGRFIEDSFDVVADATAPAINWNACQGTEGELGWLVSQATCSYGITDQQSGVDSSQRAISVDGGEYNASNSSLGGSPASSTASFTLNQQGIIDMRSRATDRVGIQSEWSDGPRVKIDTVAPVDQTVIDDAYKDSFVLDISATDATSGYNSAASTCQRRDPSGSVVTSIPCNTEIQKGESIRYTIYDFAGNSQTSSWITPVVDDTEPTVQVTGVSETCPEGSGQCTTDWSSEDVTLQITATDGGSEYFGLDRIEVSGVEYEGYEGQSLGHLEDLQLGGAIGENSVLVSQSSPTNWFKSCRQNGAYPSSCSVEVTLSEEGWRRVKFRAVGKSDSKKDQGIRQSNEIEVKIDKTPPQFTGRPQANPGRMWSGPVQVSSQYEEPKLALETPSGTIYQDGSGAKKADLMYCPYALNDGSSKVNCRIPDTRPNSPWKIVDFDDPGIVDEQGENIPPCGSLELLPATSRSENMVCAFSPRGFSGAGVWLLSSKIFDIAGNESYVPSKNGALMAGKNNENYLRGVTRLEGSADFCPILELES